MSWVEEHSSLLQVVASFGTLAIWLFYAQLLYSGYRSALTPRLLITQGVGTRENSRCMLTNMSKDMIFIQCVVIRLRTNVGHHTCAVTDFEDEQSGEVSNSLRKGTGQGPLAPGGYLDIGPFSQLIARAGSRPLDDGSRGADGESDSETETETAESLSVYVIAAYSFENGEVGAKRRFELVTPEDDGPRFTRPVYPDTRQLRSWRSRRRMRAWLREFL